MAVRLPAVVLHGEDSYTCWVLDISIGGCALEAETRLRFEIGARLRVYLTGPEFAANATVRWLHPPRRCGVQFDHLTRTPYFVRGACA